ncbi:MAG: U32 family peptidase [Candidatus Omnitrophica bacterium]|nr:U32 family peptidase [Candidatus Omnitrophota bacterium]
MQLSVPTNWQEDLLSKINKPQVKEVYGKLSKDFVGGGRSSLTTPGVSRRQAKQHISDIHTYGLEFDYLLNAACLGNWEFTISGHRKLRRLLGWLMEIKVDSITVSIPYLLQFIKKNYPNFKVYVSTIAQVSTLERARLWEDLGADRITLAHQDINRNFKLLEVIRKNIKTRLQLIVNNGCIYNCPFYIYHTVILSHASQSNHRLRGFIIDYCSLYCRAMQLTKPVNFIKSDWIRPEDLHYYEEIGYDEFKLVDREMPTDRIALIVNAYDNRSYDGNLLDILGIFSSATNRKDIEQSIIQGLIKAVKYLFRPSQVNIFRLYKLKNILTKPSIYIDNRALGNFLMHFIKEDCYLKSCKDCNWCQEIATNVVRVTSDYDHQRLVDAYKDILDEILSGRMFSYR